MKSIWVAKPPAVDEIKIFDNNDKVAKHSFSVNDFSALSSSLSKFHLKQEALATQFYFTHPSLLLVLGCYFFTLCRSVLVGIVLIVVAITMKYMTFDK